MARALPLLERDSRSVNRLSSTGATAIHLRDGTTLQADIAGPEDPEAGIVIFAHGSGSSRHSPRNRHVAEVLHRSSVQTVLLDLLTEREERVDSITREHRFDIPMLGRRVVQVVDWARARTERPIGLFGASTGAAAALMAAAERPSDITAVVSRGGRPDLAGQALARVRAPTLLIVGGEDQPVIDLNQQAVALMSAPVLIEVIPRATHLFEEPDTLDIVAGLAARWFRAHATTSETSA